MRDKFSRGETALLMYRIGRAVYEVVGYKPRGSAKCLSLYRAGLGKKKTLARMFFYKYGMDNGLSYSSLTGFTGDKNHCNAYRLRLRLNKLLSSSPETHVLYNTFKRYLQDIEAASFNNQ